MHSHNHSLARSPNHHSNSFFIAFLKTKGDDVIQSPQLAFMIIDTYHSLIQFPIEMPPRSGPRSKKTWLDACLLEECVLAGKSLPDISGAGVGWYGPGFCSCGKESLSQILNSDHCEKSGGNVCGTALQFR